MGIVQAVQSIKKVSPCLVVQRGRGPVADQKHTRHQYPHPRPRSQRPQKLSPSPSWTLLRAHRLVHSLKSHTCPLALAKPMSMVLITRVIKTMAIVKGMNARVTNFEHNVPAFKLSPFTLPSTND